MTTVIDHGESIVHPEVMEADPKPDLVEEIGRLHERLSRRIAGGEYDSVDTVLNLGSAVLFHGLLERAVVHPRHVLLDPAVMRDLQEEHRRLERHLRTLEELQRSDPASPDLPSLAQAVFHRLQQHLERDSRVIYRSLARLKLAQSGGSPPPV